MPSICIQTDWGPFTLSAQQDALTHLYLPQQPAPMADHTSTPLLSEAAEQLLAYLSGRLRYFSLPLAPSGTAFERRVWAALCDIPFGETRSYSEVACQIGAPRACRAVGRAGGKNPLPVFVPCHRMIGKNGTLTGYAGGLMLKQRLLALETEEHI